MNNYYKTIYERTDIHAFSKQLESMSCPTFFSKKKKYLYSFDKLKNCLYVKHNNCRNTLSPQIILYYCCPLKLFESFLKLYFVGQPIC